MYYNIMYYTIMLLASMLSTEVPIWGYLRLIPIPMADGLLRNKFVLQTYNQVDRAYLDPQIVNGA